MREGSGEWEWQSASFRVCCGAVVSALLSHPGQPTGPAGDANGDAQPPAAAAGGGEEGERQAPVRLQCCARAHASACLRSGSQCCIRRVRKS